MPIHHSGEGVRTFRPTGKGGGSKPGKPQWYWPIGLIVVADAIVLRARGTTDGWGVNRNAPMPRKQFKLLLGELLPGVWHWVLITAPKRKTKPEDLLYNRVYKGYYSGTSDRGKHHDPWTRACESREHWKKKVPEGHHLRKLHDQILRGLISKLPNWTKVLL